MMKKIIQTVADGGGELDVHMYPLHKILGCIGNWSLSNGMSIHY